MKIHIPENKKISPFLVLFLIHANQIGVGVLGFQRPISKEAGYDGWISILIIAVAIHIIMWLILKMCSTVDGDIMSVHEFVFGKWISKILGIFVILYLCLTIVAILRSYIEIIQVWMFPSLQTFWFSLVFFILILYLVTGGFRVITGAAFFSVIIPVFILFIFFLVLPYADFTNLLPIFDHSFTDLLKGAYTMTYAFAGFEAILFFYPFIKEPIKAKKWAHMGLLLTVAIHLYLALIAFAYFPREQLQKNIWPTITMWKIVQMPFVERFEYIGIANWCLIILPNICIPLWASGRIAKQIFGIRQKTSVAVLALFCLAAVSLFSTRTSIQKYVSFAGTAGFYFNFVYVPILFIAVLIARRVKKNGPSS